MKIMRHEGDNWYIDDIAALSEILKKRPQKVVLETLAYFDEIGYKSGDVLFHDVPPKTLYGYDNDPTSLLTLIDPPARYCSSLNARSSWILRLLFERGESLLFTTRQAWSQPKRINLHKSPMTFVKGLGVFYEKNADKKAILDTFPLPSLLRLLDSPTRIDKMHSTCGNEALSYLVTHLKDRYGIGAAETVLTYALINGSSEIVQTVESAMALSNEKTTVQASDNPYILTQSLCDKAIDSGCENEILNALPYAGNRILSLVRAFQSVRKTMNGETVSAVAVSQTLDAMKVCLDDNNETQFKAIKETLFHLITSPGLGMPINVNTLTYFLLDIRGVDQYKAIGEAIVEFVFNEDDTSNIEHTYSAGASMAYIWLLARPRNRLFADDFAHLERTHPRWQAFIGSLVECVEEGELITLAGERLCAQADTFISHLTTSELFDWLLSHTGGMREMLFELVTVKVPLDKLCGVTKHDHIELLLTKYKPLDIMGLVNTRFKKLLMERVVS